MNVKLTLKLDQAIIEQTKAWAKDHDVSLSTLVERYFARISSADHRNEVQPSGTVAELAGLLEGIDYEDPKRDYADYLAKKYA